MFFPQEIYRSRRIASDVCFVCRTFWGLESPDFERIALADPETQPAVFLPFASCQPKILADSFAEHRQIFRRSRTGSSLGFENRRREFAPQNSTSFFSKPR